jgi:putative flippase GtrA
MYTFLKDNIAAITASLVDYSIMIVLVYFFDINVIVAGITGNICGGGINFLIGRYWAFEAAENHPALQGYKYAAVWTGNVLLNVAGLYFLNNYLLINYLIAKIVTALVVAVAYNYPLQKNYVFRKN